MNATPTHEIVVLGAGYTGMMATVRLAHRTRRLPVHITLVNPSERFTERLRSHQIATGQELADLRIPEALADTGVDFRRAWATAIDTAAHRVTLDDGTELPYDTLIYALGSSADTDRVPGATEHAWTMNTPQFARGFAGQLAALAEAGGTVTVVGAGLTGIEAATEIADSHPGVTVTMIGTGEPGAMMGPKARAYLVRALDRFGINRRVGAQVVKVLPDAVELDTGEILPSDLILWTAGVRAPALAAAAGIDTDAQGAIVTDATLRSVSHPDVYAVGDAASVRQPWGHIHGTCQSGMPIAAYVADTVARRLRGKEVKPFRFGYIHQPVSLGRKDGVIQFTRGDDTPGPWYLTGRAAVRYKEFVSSSPWPTFRLSRRISIPAKFSTGARAAARAAKATA
ncbi:NAD(P)/FAD-dependent oxidoreductase [Nocardia sp. BMG111209]|uniref:NAD(P)/FAD-dependent oxidoreductase n=1 Tax=Nocardia sp. BMG111209 TaxID=1160137 RepID=UPI000372FAA9|nr:FAD-dependent oxidoreductase [Nocardia sp. BMG111209]